MNRRQFVSLAATTATVATAGCVDEEPEFFDQGTVFDRTLSEPKSWELRVNRGQVMTVAVGAIAEGDQLTVEVDDGTGVVYETVFESADADTADEYEFGRDGLHTVSLTPESTDGEEMAIPVAVKLGEP